MTIRHDSSADPDRPIQAQAVVKTGGAFVRFFGLRTLCVLLAAVMLSVSMAVVAPPAGADHVESFNQGDITRDSDVLKRYGGTWYKGGLGGTGSNGFSYTYRNSSYAYWHFGDLRGTYRAEAFHPYRDAAQDGTCGLLDSSCRRRPPTASPHYKIWQMDAQGNWEIVRDWKSRIRDANGDYKEGWWGINDVELNGYIVVEVRKRYSDNKYRLAADAFKLEWRGLIPEDREIAVTFCKAGRLDEVIQSRQIIATVDFTEAVARSVLAISTSYLVGVGAANLPGALVNALNGVHAIKNAAQLAAVAKQISDAIRVIQDSTRYLDLIKDGLEFALHVQEFTDDLVEAGVLGEYHSLYGRYQGWCKYPHGTVTDWDTGQHDPFFAEGVGGGCPAVQRWLCVPGYTEYMVSGHP